MGNLKIKLFIALFGIVTLFPTVIFAGDPYYGLDGAARQAGLQSKSSDEVPTLIGNMVGSILALIGVIFFVLMVYGGFLWMTAHGDSGQVDKGRETIIGAVIGIIIVAASYALTSFILSAPTGGTQPSAPSINEVRGCCIFRLDDATVNVEGKTPNSCQTYCESQSPAAECTFFDFDSDITPDREAEFCNSKF